jgi:DNA-directed RNA polymerase subunit H
MHILQPKHSKLNKKEIEELLTQYNISASQLPKIRKEDPCLPENCEEGDVIKIERKEEEETITYYRVVI